MGGHANKPDARRAGGIGTLDEELAIFARSEELALQRVIHQRMPDGEQEEDLHSRGPVVRGKWQKAIHA
jgi:hypothetical protein